MNKVIHYNYYLNLSNQYFWITFDGVMIIFFFKFWALPNFEKGEARHFKFGTQTDHGKF